MKEKRQRYSQSPAQVDFPERCEGSGYAVQFILKSLSFQSVPGRMAL